MKKMFKLRFSTGNSTGGGLTKRFIRPLQSEPDFRSREVVLLSLVFATLGITSLLLLLLTHSYFVAGNYYVLPRILLAGFILLYNGLVYLLVRHGHYKPAAFLLVGNYSFYALLSVWVWGVNIPFGIIMMSLSITLAGILLGARYSLYWAAGLSLTLIILQLLQELNLHTADQTWITTPASFLHVFGHCVLFMILAFVSWLFGSQMEAALLKATAAEEALLKEKRSLAQRLKERTETLRGAQMKEMQQLYRFAELGQLSTALIHDLANHLTVLTLDIEDLHKKQHSQAIARAKQSVVYLDKMVDQVRTKLQGSSRVEVFKVNSKIDEVLQQLDPKLQSANIKLTQKATKKSQQVKCVGDALRFQQIITILLTNAIDAYKTTAVEGTEKSILVELKVAAGSIEISFHDWGIGISKKDQAKLFKPFNSTKEDGMGIGLFIAKQMLETHFKGAITFSEKSGHTEFRVTIPRNASSFTSQRNK